MHILAVLALALTLPQDQPPPGPPAAQARVLPSPGGWRVQADAVLDRMHAAAARGDGPAYFAEFSPTARFIGTDASEHWSMEAFRAFADPIFAQGRGWTYHPRDRVWRSVGGAWIFDEKLSHASYGDLRGSGVLVRDGSGALKIEQYVLSFTVPNDRAEAVVALIRSGDAPR
jgi:hypothetical protein